MDIMNKISACYYGDRRVIYVKIQHPDPVNGNKMLSVYGHSMKDVLKAIDEGLTRAFGKVGKGRPKRA